MFRRKSYLPVLLLVIAGFIVISLVTNAAKSASTDWSSYSKTVNQAASQVVRVAKGSDAWPINAKGHDSGKAERLLQPLAQGQKPPSKGKVFADEHGRYCKWIFHDYVPSLYEEEWANLTTTINDEVCAYVARKQHQEASYEIVSRVIKLVEGLDPDITWSKPDTAPLSEGHAADEYFSRMRYKRVCFDEPTLSWMPSTGAGEQLIEPLWGMLRDPFDIWCAKMGHAHKRKPPGYKVADGGQSKAHILPQGFAPYRYTLEADAPLPDAWRAYGMPPWHSSLEPVESTGFGVTYRPPQHIHLDLGSSYFAGWTKIGEDQTEKKAAAARPKNQPPANAAAPGVANAAAGSASPPTTKKQVKVQNSAASGQWIYDHYHKRGLPFDRFIAVELEPLSPQNAYEQCPEDLVGKYNLVNIGLSMDKDKYNTLDLIRRTVKRQDFFVFKLDIDSAPIEMPIVNALLKDDSNKGGVSGLIDELFFEHHVVYYPLTGPWHLEGASREQVGDLQSSYKLFGNLRRKGIRAHSWP